MALENKMKEKMAQTTSRQKVIIAVMVVVVLIIIWQIVGLMGNGSSSSAPSIQPTSKMDASKPGEQDMKNTSAEAAPSADQIKKPSSGSQVDDSLRQASIVNDPQFNRLQRMTEEKYVGKLNELEELRIQRQIAETNQAITAAKLATVSAEKDISDLLTKPSPGSAMYSNQTVKTSVDVTPPSAGEPPSEASKVVPIASPQEVVPYKLMSVSMLLNKWTAIVSLQNTMFSVSVGDVLPPDGSVVTNINKNSVTLRKDGKSRKVSITASI